MLPLELAIALRYTRARRRNHFISFISLISVAGIGLGVAALIVVLSVMNGFQQELRSRILGVASHVQLVGFPLQDWQAALAVAESDPDVRAGAPYVEGQGMLSHAGNVRGVGVRGILPQAESEVSEIAGHMRSGSLADLLPGSFRVVLGKDLARAIGARVGDEVVLITPQGNVTPAGVVPRVRALRVTGIFEMGMYDYDANLALMNIDDARRIYRLGDAVSGVRLRLSDLFLAREVTARLGQQLSPGVLVTDWTRQHANFFRAVQMEKTVMFVILTLIVAVAAFNIVSTLVMMVAEKRADVAILRTLGAAPASIRHIFMAQGVLLGCVGTLVGVTVGVLVALNVENIVPAIEELLGTKFLAADVYYISDLPSRLELGDVITVAGVSLLLSFLATLLPAHNASRTPPAEALRHE